MNRNKFLVGLLIWFLGIPLTIAISIALRVLLSIEGVGMLEPIWFLLHISVLLLSLFTVYSSLTSMSGLKKMALLLSFGVIYLSYCLILTWFYIIESGIDAV